MSRGELFLPDCVQWLRHSGSESDPRSNTCCRKALQVGSSVTGLGRFVGRRDLRGRRFDPPDLAGVLGDGPVAGELSGCGDVTDHHPGPLFGVLKGNRKHWLLAQRVCCNSFESSEQKKKNWFRKYLVLW